MRTTFIIILTVALTISLYAENIEPTHIIIKHDGSILVGRVIEYTDTNIIFQKTDSDVVIIPISDAKTIKNINGSSNTPPPKPKLPTVMAQPPVAPVQQKKYGKQLVIPLSPDYAPHTRIGVSFASYTLGEDDFDRIYGVSDALSIGFILDIDYSPVTSFVIKVNGFSHSKSDIDTLGWFVDDLNLHSYDVKWSQSIFQLGPRFHYQWYLLNPYVEASLIYTTISEKGQVSNNPSIDTPEFMRGYSSFGFGYAIGVQFITPFGLTAYGEFGWIKASSGDVDLGGRYAGGGFQLNLD